MSAMAMGMSLVCCAVCCSLLQSVAVSYGWLVDMGVKSRHVCCGCGYVMGVTWLIRFDMTHSCVTWLVHVWHDSIVCYMTHWFGTQFLSCGALLLLRVTWLIHVWHDSLMCDITHLCVTWLIDVVHDHCHVVHCYWRVWRDLFMCDMTHSCVWHDSLMWYTAIVMWYIATGACDVTYSCVTWLIYVYYGYGYVMLYDTTLPFVTWRMCISDMTHSYVWLDSFMCVTWHIHVRDKTHSCVVWLWSCYVEWHDFWICDMTHLHMWYDSFVCVTWLVHVLYGCGHVVWSDMTFVFVTWRIFTCDMTIAIVSDMTIAIVTPHNMTFGFVTWHSA